MEWMDRAFVTTSTNGFGDDAVERSGRMLLIAPSRSRRRFAMAKAFRIGKSLTDQILAQAMKSVKVFFLLEQLTLFVP
jgi:hypothetical protein